SQPCVLYNNSTRLSVTGSSARCSLSLSSLLSVTRGGFLEYIFGLLNSWYSASQLLLALTQTATNWLS
ncbi:unnamed protein product, partial [Hymenolepis diminuta]